MYLIDCTLTGAVMTPIETDDLPTAHEASPEDIRIVEALRAGDEDAFRELVERYHGSLLRVALMLRAHAGGRGGGRAGHVDRRPSRPRALRGPLVARTWIFRILANQARTRGGREARSVPFSSLAEASDEPAVDPDRFLPRRPPAFPGHWASPPQRWGATPRSACSPRETRERVLRRDRGPPRVAARPSSRSATSRAGRPRRSVTCSSISEGNQRVLLHRARSKVRGALEDYLDGRAA